MVVTMAILVGLVAAMGGYILAGAVDASPRERIAWAAGALISVLTVAALWVPAITAIVGDPQGE